MPEHPTPKPLPPSTSGRALSLPGVRGKMQRRKAAEVMRRIVATEQKPGEAEEGYRELTGEKCPLP